MLTSEISYKIENEINKVRYLKKIDHNFIKDIFSLKSDQKILFVYDKNVAKFLIDDFKLKLRLTGNQIIFKELEGKKKNKNIKNLLNLFDLLIKNNFTKNSIVISCGGGVIGDMCGLLSSLYLRGTIYLHIPTTMTAIVDSCIGGKTGINYKDLINSMGSYYHPKRVYILQNLIQQIPDREYYSGFAEIIKCGLIGNDKIIKSLTKDETLNNRSSNKNLSFIVLETLKTKINFFKKDIKEKNDRLFLNFGHTFAHAIEMATENVIKKDYLRHGEAVGIGILCEILISNQGKKNELFFLTENLLKKFNLPTELKIEKKHIKKIHSEIYNGVFLDKKKISKYPRYIFLKNLFKPQIKELNNYGLLNDVIYNIINIKKN
jgi:3-dehydroquinate synthase